MCVCVCVCVTNLANTEDFIILVCHALLPRFPIIVIKQAYIDKLPCPMPQDMRHQQWVHTIGKDDKRVQAHRVRREGMCTGYTG